MLEEIVIVGAGGFGREVHQWVCDLNAQRPRFRVRGFLDRARIGQQIHDLPVLGDLDWLAAHREVGAVVAVGAPAARRRLFTNLDAWNIARPTVIHPRAVIGRNVTIGAGSVICPDVILTCDITIGRAALLNLDLTIGHDAVLGEFCTLSPGIHASGFVTMGDGCDIGTGAAFVPGIAIGAWTVIGAGAAVARDIPANAVAVGVPAKVIKQREAGWHLAE